MFNFFKRSDPVKAFWSWFAENEGNLRQFEGNPSHYLHQMLGKIRKISPGLALELEPPRTGDIIMTISANGNRDLFDMVKKIIAKAPVIKGWEFLAFRQRMSKEQAGAIKLQSGEHELDPQKMKFFPIADKGDLNIIVYVNGITESNFNQIAYSSLTLLDNILGEFDCVMKVKNYDFHDMPTDERVLEGLMPLLDLPVFVDQFYGRN
ncbi:MAG: hypothetical protein J7578_09615 [Chitinophagaceae bacterium]|nr:hypothetical protein [Chitinophagaceae bacterium]